MVRGVPFLNLAVLAALTLVTEVGASPHSRAYTGQGAVRDPTDASDEQPLPGAAARALDLPETPAEQVVSTPRNQWVYNNLVGLRANPIGFGNELFIGYRRALLVRPGLLFRDSLVAVKAHVFATPAFLYVGPRIEIQPVSVIGVSATCDVVGYFGSFGSILGYPSPRGDASDSARRERARQGDNRAMVGVNVRLSTLLQGRVGPVAVRSQLHFNYAQLPLDAQDRVYYEPALDFLHPNGGWSLLSELDAFYFFPKGWLLAVRYTVTKGFFKSVNPPLEDARDRSIPALHRLGPGVLYTFFDRPGSRFNRPTIILLSQWWIRHPWRTGVDTHPAIPYAVLAFSFEGTLWPSIPAHRKRRAPARARVR